MSAATSAENQSVRQHPCGAVAICTKDRPDEVERSCAAAYAASPNMPILVMDASATEATRYVCESLALQHGSSMRLIYRRARRSGLTRQRNEAVAACRELGVDVVHFIDDDTEVLSGYFESLEHRFFHDPTVVGLGGIITNQPVLDWLPIRRFF
jgi:hypothetical protein